MINKQLIIEKYIQYQIDNVPMYNKQSVIGMLDDLEVLQESYKSDLDIQVYDLKKENEELKQKLIALQHINNELMGIAKITTY